MVCMSNNNLYYNIIYAVQLAVSIFGSGTEQCIYTQNVYAYIYIFPDQVSENSGT